MLAIAVVTVLSLNTKAKDVTTAVPAIYDKAIAAAEKQNAIVDTIEVFSNKMGRSIKNTVVLPAQYSEKKNPTRFFPVVYLLHGAQGSYRDWPKKADLRSLASQYGVIIVCPDGQDSWYFAPESQVALFSYRIAHLTEHVKKNKKDVVTRRSLLRLVSKRRQLLNYLQKVDIERYRAIIKELGLRR